MILEILTMTSNEPVQHKKIPMKGAVYLDSDRVVKWLWESDCERVIEKRGWIKKRQMKKMGELDIKDKNKEIDRERGRDRQKWQFTVGN